MLFKNNDEKLRKILIQPGPGLKRKIKHMNANLLEEHRRKKTDRKCANTHKIVTAIDWKCI